MKVSIEYKTTTNRTVYNRARKEILKRKGQIHCTSCRYHRGENNGKKWYHIGDRTKRYPNWKLTSKNKKQWMNSPVQLKEVWCNGYTRTYYEFVF